MCFLTINANNLMGTKNIRPILLKHFHCNIEISKYVSTPYQRMASLLWIRNIVFCGNPVNVVVIFLIPITLLKQRKINLYISWNNYNHLLHFKCGQTRNENFLLCQETGSENFMPWRQNCNISSRCFCILIQLAHIFLRLDW